MKELAICIPAYNRLDCLIELLITITNQLDNKNRDRIQICISDDCSPNDLEKPVREYLDIFNIEYIFYRNSENIGFDRNVIKSIEISNAKYCWLMGDDDGIPDGKLNIVLDYINKYSDINVFFGNRYVCNRKLRIKLKEKWTKDKNDFIIDFNNDDEVINYFNKLNSTTCLGYLTTLIIKKEVWDSIKETEYTPYLKTIYIQVAKYMLMLYKKYKLFRISDYIALSRFGNDNFFYSLKQRIFMDLYGFLQLSDIFCDNLKIKDSFLGIVRRHYNNIFLNAMSFTAALNEDEIEIIRKIGYTKKQIKIFIKRNRIKAFFCFLISVIKTIFTDFYWFYKTCFVTIQKLLP